MKIAHIILGAATMLAAGCAHEVTFEQPEKYVVSGTRQEGSIQCVMDSETLARKVSIRSFMTGVANEWVVEPGDMLKQVADIEMPQMFSHYEFVTAYHEPGAPGRAIAVELKIPSYVFEDFHAKVAVSAVVTDRDRRKLLEKTYTAEGLTQGAKMFWAGAFAMKSAIRQSSLDAFKKVFVQLRADLATLPGR